MLMVKSACFVYASGPLSKSALATVPAQWHIHNSFSEVREVNMRTPAAKCVFVCACPAWTSHEAGKLTDKEKVLLGNLRLVYAKHVVLEPSYETALPPF